MVLIHNSVLLFIPFPSFPGEKMVGEFIKPTSVEKTYVVRQSRAEILRERFERLPAADQ